MMAEMICEDCGKPFEYELKPNGHRRYCDACNRKHRREPKTHNRSDGQRFRCTQHAKTSIDDVLALAPKYGLKPYEYGKIMTKLAWGDGI